MLDMGTNTFLLLIAEWQARERTLTIIRDEHCIARLGAGVAETGSIAPDSIERALKIASFYNEICSTSSPRLLWGIGTAVFRRAQNSSEALDKISKCFQCCPSRWIVLSPEEEAQLSYWGALLPYFPATSALVIDIGGGSTELIVGRQSKSCSMVSLPLGAVWLWEKVCSDNDSVDTARKFVKELLKTTPLPKLDEHCQAYATAGTPVTLAAIVHGVPYHQWWRVHKSILSREHVEKLLSWLWQLSVEERRQLPSVHPERAEILPAGALILAVLMEYFRLPTVRVSVLGLRYGALWKLLQEEEGVSPGEPIRLIAPEWAMSL